MTANFIEIWNQAYNIYIDMGKKDLKEFLKIQTESGSLSKADAIAMEEDIIETATL